MPIFLGVHKFPAGETADKTTDDGWNKYKQTATSMGLKPLKVLISLEHGVAYCQTEADSADKVKEAHNKAEIPFEEIVEVKSLD